MHHQSRNNPSEHNKPRQAVWQDRHQIHSNAASILINRRSNPKLRHNATQLERQQTQPSQESDL